MMVLWEQMPYSPIPPYMGRVDCKRERFFEVLKAQGSSIRKLGEAYLLNRRKVIR